MKLTGPDLRMEFSCRDEDTCVEPEDSEDKFDVPYTVNGHMDAVIVMGKFVRFE
jgi:hypothetical protein